MDNAKALLHIIRTGVNIDICLRNINAVKDKLLTLLQEIPLDKQKDSTTAWLSQ